MRIFVLAVSVDTCAFMYVNQITLLPTSRLLLGSWCFRKYAQSETANLPIRPSDAAKLHCGNHSSRDRAQASAVLSSLGQLAR